MKYSYAYKTSDGARHEDAMDAPSREAVFEALRAKGIKAIKVVASDGSKANGEVHGVNSRAVVGVAVAAAIVAAACAYYVGTRGTPVNSDEARFSRYSAEERSVYLRLAANVAGLEKPLTNDNTEAEMARRLTQNAGVSAVSIHMLYELIDNRASAIAGTRKEMRREFAVAAAGLSPDGHAMRDIQRLYGVKMSQLDAWEIANATRRLALDILDKNRGKWKPGKNGPEFSDSRLAKMYNYCLEGLSTDAATARWQRDFAPTAE